MKSAVVTGAGSGIGAAIARRMLVDGWAVVAVDNQRDGLAQYAENTECPTIVGDVADRSTHARAGERAADIGELHAWISVAGVTATHRLHALDESAARRIIDINQMGALLGAAEAVTRFRATGTPGVVVGISSIHGSHSAVHYPVYEMTKAAIDALTRSIAVSYGADGIRAVAIAPGAIRTPALTASIEASGDPETTLARLRESSPLQRLGQPEEIAEAVAFVTSDRASFITGTTIVVDGGWTSVLLGRRLGVGRRGLGRRERVPAYGLGELADQPIDLFGGLGVERESVRGTARVPGQDTLAPQDVLLESDVTVDGRLHRHQRVQRTAYAICERPVLGADGIPERSDGPAHLGPRHRSDDAAAIAINDAGSAGTLEDGGAGGGRVPQPRQRRSYGWRLRLEGDAIPELREQPSLQPDAERAADVAAGVLDDDRQRSGLDDAGEVVVELRVFEGHRQR